MKILVLDADQGHNKRVTQSLGGDPKTELIFFDQISSLIETLNGLPQFEKSKAELEKIIADTNILLNKANENITSLTTAKDAKAKEAAMSQADVSVGKKLLDEVKTFDAKIKTESETKTKLEDVVSKKKAELEAISKKVLSSEQKKCNVLMVDRAFLGNKPLDWLNDFRSKITLLENKEVPIAVLGYNSELEYIYSIMVPGISDYFIKPVDLLLMKHNTAKLSGKTMEADDKVYEIQTKALVKVLSIAKVIKLSEFEMTAQVRSPFNPNELVELFADVFNMKKGERLLATCKKCDPDEAEKGFFVAVFSFVGLSPHIMNEIRKWLKIQYVNAKEKES
ncbi:MAG: hypothetical protein A4S09_16690 [Proteobacteria bacterium SG_bin7]|nr:MAG: hypothetical protein A4S09_16690 [Proteobacteria bacterium SG_bin7]